MFQEINEIAGKRKSGPASSCIKDKDGKMLIEKNEVLTRWAEYIEDLFQDDRQDKPHKQKPYEGPPILKDEVRKAMKMMNHGRAAGPDGITIEALIALGEWGISQITDLLNIIYDNGEIPEEMCKSVFIMLPKKEGATECSLHRTISLMSHLTKFLLRIIMAGIRGKLRPEISNNQFGFVEDRGTRNVIFTLTMIIERAIEMKKDLYLCFIDYSKAFD
ncbi:RNA-directed DNA polymerase from mobile element jockey-like [Elysia marginata]|uniref:RNA-directed DNA polymerase from mobile element jockey-like n=1 Tax=Elysia marginata TaxID=1093978 RepID=A0AAV4I079_9GAST|nr:RNA-directed DNA polymerase from mobile element jockey-like [Elysia marginata]